MRAFNEPSNLTYASFHCDDCGCRLVFNINMSDRLCDTCRSLARAANACLPAVDEWFDLSAFYALQEVGATPAPVDLESIPRSDR